MSNNQMVHRVPAPIDPVDAFGYPATAQMEICQCSAGEFHDITYAGAPGALFNNAPNASRLYDVTNSDLYIKAGAVGSGKAGAWVKASP